MVKSDKGKPSPLMTPELDTLVKFFCLLDTFYCFLVKNKLTCTLSKLQSMMRGQFDISSLLMLQALCPRVLEVAVLPSFSSQALDAHTTDKEAGYPHLEVVFFVEGIGKGAKASRLKLVTDACAHYCRSSHDMFMLQEHPPGAGVEEEEEEEEEEEKKKKKKKDMGGKAKKKPKVAKSEEQPPRKWHPAFRLQLPTPCALPLPSRQPTLPPPPLPLPEFVHKSTAQPSKNIFNSAAAPQSKREAMTAPGSVLALLDRLRAMPYYSDQMVHVEKVAGRVAQYAQLARPLHPALAAAFRPLLHCAGPATATASSARDSAESSASCEEELSPQLRLYSHQVLAIDALRDGKHVTISTPTASGKSLVYNLPVLESVFAGDPEGCTALYLYPTKALAQDQLQSLEALLARVEQTVAESLLHSSPATPGPELVAVPAPVNVTMKCNACTVDGDTSFSRRAFAQKHAHIILTNPDMLSCTLLPQHTQWSRFFARVRFVVVDEAHMYKGVFGAHVSAVLRRLVRVCLYHRQHQLGRDFSQQPLQFVLSSATISNPVQHMQQLVPVHCLSGSSTSGQSSRDRNEEGRAGELVGEGNDCIVSVDATKDGSPRGDRYFVLWNPPLSAATNVDVSSREAQIVAELGKTQEGDTGCANNRLHAREREGHTQEKVSASTLKRPRDTYSLTSSVTCTHSSSASDDEEGFMQVHEPNCDDVHEFDHDDEEEEEKGSEAVACFLQGCEESNSAWAVSCRGSGPDSRAARRLQRQAQATTAAINASLRCAANSLLKCTSGMVAGLPPPPPPVRTSSIVQTALLFSSLIMEERRVLAFCHSRKLVELVLQYATRELFKAERQDLQHAITGYRGGYTKEQRREIEQKLFGGALLGLTATSALELGIDVGGLDATLHLGVPSSQSSLAQQSGRCGRGRDQPEALSIIVCFDSPVDQYYALHPRELFARGTEPTSLRTNNPYVLRAHLLCAAYEVPLRDFDRPSPALQGGGFSEEALWGGGYQQALDYLLCSPLPQPIPAPIADGSPIADSTRRSSVIRLGAVQTSSYEHAKLVEQRGSRPPVSGRGEGNTARPPLLQLHPHITHPWREVNIRSCEPATFQVIVGTGSSSGSGGEGSVLGNVGYSRAFYELHEGAVYLHQGRQYLVTMLCLEALFARCTPVRLPYHTAAHSHHHIDVLRRLHACGVCGFGMVTIRSSVTGFVKIFREGGGSGSRAVWGGECSLPQLEYDTCGIWFDVPASLRLALGTRAAGAAHAANHALRAAAGITGHCDLSDLDSEHFHTPPPSSPQLQFPAHRRLETTACEKEDDMGEGVPPAPIPQPSGNSARLLLYDKTPGGSGACEALYQHVLQHSAGAGAGVGAPATSVLHCAEALLRDCPCTDGCPSCLLSSDCSTHNSTFDKQGAMFLLQKVIDLVYGTSTGPSDEAQEGAGTGGFLPGLLLHAHVSAAMEPARRRSFVIRKDWNATNPQFLTSSSSQTGSTLDL